MRKLFGFNSGSLLLLVVLLAAAVGLTACQGRQKAPESPPPALQLGKVAILPFNDMSRVYGANTTVRCPVCGRVFTTGEVADGAAEFLTERTFALLKNRDDAEVLPPGMGRGVVSNLTAARQDRHPSRDLLAEAGRTLGADTVLTGFVYRYSERVGNSFAVDRPASVAFGMHILRTTDGAMLWSGNFDETQRPLSDDLLGFGQFMKRRGSWISAAEMATTALESMLERIPGS